MQDTINNLGRLLLSNVKPLALTALVGAFAWGLFALNNLVTSLGQ